MTGSRLAIVVLMATAWPRVSHRTKEIRAAIEEVAPGQVREVPIGGNCPASMLGVKRLEGEAGTRGSYVDPAGNSV